MSREEIDRIMNSDFSSVDTTIQKQLHAIDLMTGQLSENSLFLSQFQKLLHQELIPKHHNPTHIVQPEQSETKQTVLELDSALFEDELEETYNQPSNAIPEQDNRRQSDPLIEMVGISPKYVDPLAYVRRLEQKVSSTRQYLSEEKERIKQYLIRQKQQAIVQLKQAVERVKQIFLEQHQAQISKLSVQNHQLKQQLQALRKKQLQIQQNSLIRSSLDPECQRLPFCQKIGLINQRKPHRSNKKIAPHSVCQNGIKQSPLLLIGDCSSKNFQYAHPTCFQAFSEPNSSQRKYFQQRNLQRCPNESFSLPDIKPINIGIAPVQNGFGILAFGATTVYRGMWKQGKFSGKGNLTWNNYCYEGDFQNGMFSGFGKLRLDIGTYLGKFLFNRAEGEGTFESQSARLSGLWKNNCLAKPY